ncbi:MAG: flagellin FliC, partial [Sphingomonadales bacterium]|nr:flagellin FliC [Sphingomonadales bacterium]
AVQSSSGTYQSSDRDQMQAEVTSLTNQISNVLGSTTFNGVALFSTTSGTNVTFNIQAGANNSASNRIAITSTGFDGTQLVNTLAGGKGFQVNDTTGSAGSGVTNAQTTIDNVDSVLKQVATVNANFGAGQSQLTSAVNNMTNNVTNLSAARSRIQDTDYSAESTAMAKAQILSQASTAMIAQANQSQQNVLSLLK